MSLAVVEERKADGVTVGGGWPSGCLSCVLGFFDLNTEAVRDAVKGFSKVLRIFESQERRHKHTLGKVSPNINACGFDESLCCQSSDVLSNLLLDAELLHRLNENFNNFLSGVGFLLLCSTVVRKDSVHNQQYHNRHCQINSYYKNKQ